MTPAPAVATISTSSSPFEYAAMIWATLWGFLLFGDFPDWTGAGATLVIGAGLYMLGAARRHRSG